MENTETKRIVDKCEITEKIIDGRRYFKCSKTNKEPTAEEIIDHLKVNKIVYNL